MKIFNTLSRRKEEFVPLTPGVVKMYVCGPTVYNFIHIGNARPMIVFDTVRRYFEYKGYEVQYVSNFTDVDDKIIKKAIEEGVDADTISKRYIEECKKDMASMNVKPATVHPLATEEICGMLDMIGTLIEKGHAYAAADGTVYFRTGSFKEYGKLSHKNLEDLQSGFREIKVTGEEGKEDPADFVLWKPKKGWGTLLGVSLVPGPSGLAHRVLGDVQEISGRTDRHPRRRRGPDFPPSRERDRPERIRQR